MSDGKDPTVKPWSPSPQLAALALLVGDIFVIAMSIIFAYWVRFEGAVTAPFLPWVAPMMVMAVLAYPVSFWAFGLYRQVLKHVSVDVLVRVGLAVAIVTGAFFALDMLLTGTTVGDVGLRPVPVGVVLSAPVFILLGCAGLRVLVRVARYLQTRGSGRGQRRVLIVGAGDAGFLLLRDIENQPELGLKVVGFVDDRPRMWGRVVSGTRVLGPLSDIPELVRTRAIDLAYIALPSATRSESRHALDLCVGAGVTTRVMAPLVDGTTEWGVADLRNVRIEDLLGRDPVEIDVESVRQVVAGRVVAVTGAAGSIGSELCRQLADMRPGLLLLLDIDESRLYDLDQELGRTSDMNVAVEICDLRDRRKIRTAFERYRPAVVFHAAAYKHVPLMEKHPDEAVKTNVAGSRNVIATAEETGVERFVLISTDKAVHPSSIMGLTKAVSERLLLRAHARGRMIVCAVRFGNVLASRGSVVPLFEEQLRAGGPLTVTDPEATRYFMTIPEAARLVLQAGAVSRGGEIFVLEMGEPVKILDLARKMIVLSGADVAIEFIGLRPAEKLHEVLVHEAGELEETVSPKILKVVSMPEVPESIDAEVDALVETAWADDRPGIEAGLLALIPESQRKRPERES